VLDVGELVPYGPQEYFAFVEGDELLDPGALRRNEAAWWAPILERRRQLGFAPPDRFVWLDCVSARFFAELPWRKEICEIGDVEQARRRRAQIQALREHASQFIVVPLFMSRYDELPSFEKSFGAADWHRIEIGPQPGVPVLVSEQLDFDHAGSKAQLRNLRYIAECYGDELRSLRNVFNLDFLPDADLGANEGGTPGAPPHSPSPNFPDLEELLMDERRGWRAPEEEYR
jgi:hypothetical protein